MKKIKIPVSPPECENIVLVGTAIVSKYPSLSFRIALGIWKTPRGETRVSVPHRSS